VFWNRVLPFVRACGLTAVDGPPTSTA
jgi:hypothetical protein